MNDFINSLFNGDPKVTLSRVLLVGLFATGVFSVEDIQAAVSDSASLADRIEGLFQAFVTLGGAATSTNKGDA